MEPIGSTMNQLGLFDLQHLSRKGEETSAEAVVTIARSGHLARQAEQVLAALKEYPGATSAELAARYDMDRYTPSRRLPGLERAGLARREGRRLCKVTGMMCIVWQPVESSEDAPQTSRMEADDDLPF
jgi:hypothetical protein